MNDFQDIKRMLLPVIGGLPFIAGCMIVALLIGYRSILYTNPLYESTAKIKLDDVGQGISSSSLYEDFDVFVNTNKIAAEVEVLKSKLLLKKSLENLDFDVSYFRVGKIRKTELYHETPFLVQYTETFPLHHSKTFQLHITSENAFQITLQEQLFDGQFGEPIALPGFEVTLLRNEELLAQKSNVDLVDEYEFQIHSKAYIVDHLILDNLTVMAVDKDVAVIRVSLKSEVPEKAAAFVNALSKTYVEDYIDSRTGAAGKTVNFIDEQLAVVGQKLRDAEAKLETYRLKHNIINTRQETETDLRKIAQLKIQLANMEMNEAALDSLNSYINKSGQNFMDLAPNFEAYNDLLSTELIKKLKQYQAEKKDLLLKYTAEDEKVKVIDEKVADIELYIRESIKNSRLNIAIKRQEIEQTIAEAEKVFIGLPSREKQMVILERDFQLNQKVFNFLTEKRTESAIAASVNIAFHRIIQAAEIPMNPISPKKALIMIVSGLLSLIGSIALIYGRQFIQGKISTRSELEKLAATPVAGVIKKNDRGTAEEQENFQELASSLQLQNNIKEQEAILITSALSGEGKSYTAACLAKAYADLGWKVLLIDLNVRSPKLHEQLLLHNKTGISDIISNDMAAESVIQKAHGEALYFLAAGSNQTNANKVIAHKSFPAIIGQLKEQFDLLVIDSPATAIAMDAIQLMQHTEHVYHLVRANFTPSQFIQNADMIAEEYQVDRISLLLNATHKATNFSGRYTGSRFSYNLENKGLIYRLNHYRKVYFRHA